MKMSVCPDLSGVDYILLSETSDEARYFQFYYKTVEEHLKYKIRVVQPKNWYLFFLGPGWTDFNGEPYPASLNFCLFSCAKGLDIFRNEILVPFEKKYILVK